MAKNSRARVVILASSLDATAGGVERFTATLRDALSGEADVEVVLAPSVGSRWARRLGVTGLLRARRSREFVKAARPDVVVTNGSVGAIGRGPWTRIHVFHGTLPSHSIADRHGRRLRDWLVAGVVGGGISELLAGIGAVKVAVSESVAEELKRWYRFSCATVIENGVRNSSKEQPHVERAGLVYVGRRESRKGYGDAVAVAELVGERLVVAGPGSDHRTVDLGVLSEVAVARLFATSRAFVFPTRYEACSLAILEAMIAGCPVITTEVGWTRSLLKRVPSYEALIVSPSDVGGAARIAQRLSDPASAEWVAVREAQDVVKQRNSFGAFKSNWSTLLSRVIEEHGSRR